MAEAALAAEGRVSLKVDHMAAGRSRTSRRIDSLDMFLLYAIHVLEILGGQVHRAEGACLGDDVFVGFGDYDSEVGEPAHPALGSTADEDRATGETSGEGLCGPERLRGLSRAAGCQQEGASRGGKN